jgi:hypothetical protein
MNAAIITTSGVEMAVKTVTTACICLGFAFVTASMHREPGPEPEPDEVSHWTGAQWKYWKATHWDRPVHEEGDDYEQ